MFGFAAQSLSTAVSICVRGERERERESMHGK